MIGDGRPLPGRTASWAESGHHRFSDHLQVGIYIVFRTDRRRNNQAGSGINIFTQACLAAIGITVMMALAFRNPWIGLVGLVPNLFPIVLVIGAMGWMGLPVNIATAMIASVSLGLTVDSSIHYISGFRRARAAGDDVATALERTHAGVGRAVVLANLALVVGFSVLTLSHFIPLVYFGILVSVAMLGGLAGNLVLLPVLLAWVEGRR